MIVRLAGEVLGHGHGGLRGHLRRHFTLLRLSVKLTRQVGERFSRTSLLVRRRNLAELLSMKVPLFATLA